MGSSWLCVVITNTCETYIENKIAKFNRDTSATFCLLKISLWARELAQQGRACGAPKELSLGLSTHSRQLISPSLGDPIPFSGLYEHPHTRGIHISRHKHIHLNKNET